MHTTVVTAIIALHQLLQVTLFQNIVVFTLIVINNITLVVLENTVIRVATFTTALIITFLF